jgi:hypothetical protein
MQGSRRRVVTPGNRNQVANLESRARGGLGSSGCFQLEFAKLEDFHENSFLKAEGCMHDACSIMVAVGIGQERL